jgi:hypothetical protein
MINNKDFNYYLDNIDVLRDWLVIPTHAEMGHLEICKTTKIMYNGREWKRTGESIWHKSYSTLYELS